MESVARFSILIQAISWLHLGFSSTEEQAMFVVQFNLQSLSRKFKMSKHLPSSYPPVQLEVLPLRWELSKPTILIHTNFFFTYLFLIYGFMQPRLALELNLELLNPSFHSAALGILCICQNSHFSLCWELNLSRALSMRQVLYKGSQLKTAHFF